MNFRTVVPNLGCDVLFWGIDITKEDIQRDEGDKVKEFHVHAGCNPWILCVDRNDCVILWDYAKKTKLWKKSIAEIASAPDWNGQPKGEEASAKKAKSIIGMNSDITMCGQIPSYMAAAHLPASVRSAVGGSAYIKQVFARHGINSSSSNHAVTSSHSSSTSATTTSSSARNNIGEVHLVSFMDAAHMEYTLNDPYTLQATTVNKSSNVLIVTDSAVIIYDFIAHKSKVIVFTDSKPVSATFVFWDLCAIGMSDGSIRIWDCQQWREVKVLRVHTKEVTLIKALPIVRRIVDDAGTIHDFVKSTATGSSSVMREGNIRFLSIGGDGTGLIWSGGVMGNIVQIDTPSARLQENVGAGITRNGVFIDEEANVLNILCTDRSLRLYMLDSLEVLLRSGSRRITRKVSLNKDGIASLSASAQPSRRSSITAAFTRSSAIIDEALASIPTWSCEVKHRPSQSLTPQTSKIVGVVQCRHPVFRSGVLISCSKSNELCVLQPVTGADALQAAGDNQSDSSSVVDGPDSAVHGRLVLSQVLNMNTLLALYSKTLTIPIPLAILSHACDPALKVYSVQTHKLKLSWLFLATNLGVMALELAPRYVYGPFQASHPRWNSSVLRVVGPSSNVVCSRIDINPTSTSTHAANEYGPTCSATIHSVDITSCTFTNTNNRDPSSPTIPLNSRPHTFASPSGNYCALFWPDVNVYSIVSTSSLCSNNGNGPGRSSATETVEIDRGFALAIAWIGRRDIYSVLLPAKRGESVAAKRRMSLFVTAKDETGQTASGGHGASLLIPPSIMFKQLVFHADTKSIESNVLDVDVNDEFGASEAQDLFGGPLLMVSSPLRAYSSKAAKGGGQKSLSKIEADALEAQLEAAAAAAEVASSNASGGSAVNLASSRLANITSARSAAAKLAEERIGCGSDSLCRTQCSQFYRLSSKSSGGSISYYMEPVGPVMHGVSSVVWASDHPQCAIIQGNRINILTASSQGTNVSLSVVATVALESPHLSIFNSMHWSANMLFVATPLSVHVVSLHPSESATHQTVSSLHTCTRSRRVDVYQLASAQRNLICPSRCTLNGDALLGSESALLAKKLSMSYWSLPSGLMEILGIHKGQLLLSSRDFDRITCIPLTANPIVAIAALLDPNAVLGETRGNNHVAHIPRLGSSLSTPTGTTGNADLVAVLSPNAEAALRWGTALPKHTRDYVVRMMLRRGFAIEATLLPGCSMQALLLCCRSARSKEEELYYLRLLKERQRQIPFDDVIDKFGSSNISSNEDDGLIRVASFPRDEKQPLVPSELIVASPIN